MYHKRYNAPDLRAVGMFNLSVIPDWETIGSARMRLSSLDHLSENHKTEIEDKLVGSSIYKNITL